MKNKGRITETLPLAKRALEFREKAPTECHQDIWKISPYFISAT